MFIKFLLVYLISVLSSGCIICWSIYDDANNYAYYYCHMHMILRVLHVIMIIRIEYTTVHAEYDETMHDIMHIIMHIML